jgi:hypothetical protein
MTDLGKAAYEAYCATRAPNKVLLPQWQDLRPEIQESWHKAAEAAVIAHLGLDKGGPGWNVKTITGPDHDVTLTSAPFTAK